MGKPRKKKPKPAQKYSNDRLGHIAQDQIALFAESANLNKSASNPDRDGWDFHLSVPRALPVDGSNFFDGDRPLTAMFVQVKGTIGTERRRAVALSHWHHAATMPMPFFFVVVEFTDPPTPAHLYIVHVDEELVEAVAHRLRKEGAKAKSKPPKLNRLTLDLTWDESHEVPCNAEGMRAALVTHAGEDMSAYAATKRIWWGNAGSSTVTNKMTLQFKGPAIAADQRLADWALGLTEHLRVDRLSRVEHRWGIPRAHDSTDALLSFTSPPSIGTSPVQIASRDGTEQVQFDADMFCNVCFIPYLPKETWGLRLVWKFLQIVFRAGSAAVTVRLTIPPNAPPIPLVDLATAARAIRLLTSPCNLTYTIPKYGDDMTYTSELNRREDEVIRADGELDVLAMLKGAEAAWALCSLFGVPHATSIHPGELEARAKELEEWRTVQIGEGVTAQIEVPDRDGLTENETAAFLWFPLLKLGSHDLVTAAVVKGAVEFVGDRGRITAKPVFARRWAVDRRHRSKWVTNQFPRLVYELTRELESKDEKLCLIASKSVAAAVNELKVQDEVDRERRK